MPQIKVDDIVGLMADIMRPKMFLWDMGTEELVQEIKSGQDRISQLRPDLQCGVSDLLEEIGSQLIFNFGPVGRQIEEEGEDITLLELAKRMAEYANIQPSKASA